MTQTSFEHYYYQIESEWNSREHFHIKVNTSVKEVTDDGVVCETDGEESFVKADTVILSMGYRNDAAEVMQYAGLSTQFFYIGDCEKARSVQAAMRDGYSIGSTI